jgi:hypothetical protein
MATKKVYNTESRKKSKRREKVTSSSSSSEQEEAIEKKKKNVRKESTKNSASTFEKFWTSSSDDESLNKTATKPEPAASKKPVVEIKTKKLPEAKKLLAAKSKFGDVEFVPLGVKNKPAIKPPPASKLRPEEFAESSSGSPAPSKSEFKKDLSLQRPIFRAPEKVSFLKPACKSKVALPVHQGSNEVKPIPKTPSATSSSTAWHDSPKTVAPRTPTMSFENKGFHSSCQEAESEPPGVNIISFFLLY